MSITWPTKEQIRASILALYQAERPDADSTKYSDLWLNSRIWSVLQYRAHRTIKQALDAVFPNTSFGSYLDAWLSTYGLPDGQGGFGRVLPHISAADAGFTIETAAGMAANLTLNQQLTDSANNTYVITEQNALIAPGGTEDVDIESVDTGFTTNLEAGTVLTWVTPPAGADATGTLAKALTGGTDLGEDSAEQVRLLAKVRNPSASGNVAHWVEVIEAVSPGFLKAYVWPQRQNRATGPNHGAGTTDYCALKIRESSEDRDILAADDLYTDIAAAVAANLPALIYLQSRQLTITDVNTDIDVTITLGDGATEEQKCDWDAESIKRTVTNSVPGTGVITSNLSVTTLSVTNGIAVDDKVVINGIEGTVTAIDGADDKVFTVGDWPDGWGSGVNPLNGLYICSGGGFVGQKTDFNNNVTGSGCTESIRAYMDGLGPNVLYNAAQSEIPGWESSARIQALESECFVAGGGVIVDVVVNDLGGGVVDLVHAADDDATASLFNVDEIAVWQVFV
jgi:uncharacterized phage protein gp47/JayE